MTAKRWHHVTARAFLFIIMGALSVRSAENVTKLSDAVRENDAAQVKDLLARKVDVNAQSYDGSTALMVAADKGNPEVIRMLLKAGAKPALADENGDTPLSIAALHGKLE